MHQCSAKYICINVLASGKKKCPSLEKKQMQDQARVKVGLVGYGKAGQAVAKVLLAAPEIDLQWVARRQPLCEQCCDSAKCVPVVGLGGDDWAPWLDDNPVDAIIDFSTADSLWDYGPAIDGRPIMLVSAVSAYGHEHQAYLRKLAHSLRVMSSPNITLGINFLLAAASLLRDIAPFADVEIVEQHFRDKPEVSGTARVIAQSLRVDEDKITSLRFGGIIGHHEVIFGFPHQTVRLVHDSIRREAFGTGALFALMELSDCPVGFYTFEDLLKLRIQRQWRSRGLAL
jgi:4-hydroxy-tetrahydrodipicolinate reductase